MPEYVASVFVSHAHEDKPRVRKICAYLKESGFRIWLDEDDLRIGDSLPDGIFRAIDQIDFVLALNSANSVDSSWCRKEWSFAVNVEIRRGVVVVLPVRMDHTPMPLLFEDKVHLDIRSMNPRQAADRIMKSIHEHLAPTRTLPALRVRSMLAPLPNPAHMVLPPRRRLRENVLIGVVLAALSWGPASPVASVSEVGPSGHLYLPYS